MADKDLDALTADLKKAAVNTIALSVAQLAVKKVTDQLATTVGAFDKQVTKAAKDVEDLTKKLDDLYGKLSPLGGALKTVADNLDAIEKLAKSGAMVIVQNAKAMGELEANSTAAAKGQDAVKDAMKGAGEEAEKHKEKLKKVQDAAKELGTSMIDVVSALASGKEPMEVLKDKGAEMAKMLLKAKLDGVNLIETFKTLGVATGLLTVTSTEAAAAQTAQAGASDALKVSAEASAAAAVETAGATEAATVAITEEAAAYIALADSAGTSVAAQTGQVAVATETAGATEAATAAITEEAAAYIALAESAGTSVAAQTGQVTVTIETAGATEAATAAITEEAAAYIALAESASTSMAAQTGATTAALEQAAANGAIAESSGAAIAGQAGLATAAAETTVAFEAQAVAAAEAATEEAIALAPLGVLLAGIAATVGVVAGAFAIAAHDISSEVGDLTKDMGLTGEQLDRVKDKSVTMGDVAKATFEVLGKRLNDVFGPSLKAIGDTFLSFYHTVTEVAFKAVAETVGAFVGAFEAIRASWSLLPGAIGDIVVSAVQVVLDGIATMINKAIGLANGMVHLINDLAEKLGLPLKIPDLGHVDSIKIANQFAGMAKNAGEVARGAFQKGLKGTADWILSIPGEIKDVSIDVATDRIAHQAGDPPEKAGGGKASAAAETAKAVRVETETVAASNVVWLEANQIAAAYAEQQKAKATAQSADIKTMEQVEGKTIHLSSAMESLSIEFERSAKISNLMSGAVTGIADAIKKQDWVGAFGGLFSLMDQVQVAFKEGQSSAEKFAAITGLAQGVGKVVGGKIGAGIGGAASGAQAGFQIGGPWGAAIGAALGGFAGLLGVSNAKAQAKIDALMKAQQDLQAKQKESSGAIEKALGLAGQYQNTDLDYSNAILASLRSIDSKIGVVAASIVRGITSGGLLSTSGLGLGSTSSGSGLGGALVGGALGGVAGAGLGAAATAATGFLMSGFGGVATALAGPFGLALGAVGALVGALSKTKKTVEVLDQGLNFSAQTFGQITASGLVGSQYADLLTTTKKSFAGLNYSTKVSTSTVASGIDPTLLAQIGGTIQLLGEGVVTAAKTFGDDAGEAANAALQNVSIDLGKLSLKDLKPEEIETAINAMFDRVADELASAGVPALKDLAKAGEGAFETLTRLATEYKTIEASLASVGMAFKPKGVESLGARKYLLDQFGGADAFASQTAFFGEHFLTDEDRLKPIKASVMDSLAKIGQPADLSREGFKALVQSQDLSTKEGADLYKMLMDLAPAFDKVATAAENVRAKQSSIQDQIDDLVMTPAQKLAKSRGAEKTAVEALDASLVPLLKNLWDLQDAAQAAADATQLASDRSSMLADLFDAQGRTSQATKLRRDLALAQIKDPIQQIYQTQIWAAQDAAAKVESARQALTEAYQREHDAIQATKDKFSELSKSLRAFSGSLSATIAGTDLATRYRTTRQAFMATAALARLGDAGAMERLQSDGEAFTAASKDYQSTSLDYLRDIGLVRSAVDEAADTADRQVSIAEQQLKDLDASVQGLIDINGSVISVRDAITNLQSALTQAMSAGVASVGGSSLGLTPPATQTSQTPVISAGGVNIFDTPNVDLTRFNDATKQFIGQMAWTAYESRDPSLYHESAWDTALRLDFQKRIDSHELDRPLGFATGGSFEVGGSGPPDSKLFNLALSPGEAVNVQRGDQKGDQAFIQELRSLRDELASLRASSDRIATSNDKMERTLTNVTEGGRAMQTQAAA